MSFHKGAFSAKSYFPPVWFAEADDSPTAIPPAENRYGPTCEVVTSRRGRRTANRPAVSRADIAVVCRVSCQSSATLRATAALDIQTNAALEITANLSTTVTVNAEINTNITASADHYDTLLEMLLAA